MNRYTIGSNLARVLVDRLRTPQSLELAIERAAQLHSTPDPAPGPKREYCRSDGLNRLAEFGFLAYVKLSDYEKAIDFFKIHYADRDTEVSLFVLLQWLRSLIPITSSKSVESAESVVSISEFRLIRRRSA